MSEPAAPRAADRAARRFRGHAIAFGSVNVALQIANAAMGAPWWAFWPLAAWGLVFGAHYLVYKARRVDERWADERTADLHSKSYDAAHMDRIGERYGAESENDQGRRAGRR